jgi:CBS domain-containing protein
MSEASAATSGVGDQVTPGGVRRFEGSDARRVGDAMVPLADASMDEMAKLGEAARIMERRRVSALPVMGDGGRFVGLLSYRTLLGTVSSGADQPVGEVVRGTQMVESWPLTIRCDASLLEALVRLRGSAEEHLLVVDRCAPVGFIGEDELFTAMSGDLEQGLEDNPCLGQVQRARRRPLAA